jgi:hypothetical protein
VVFAWKGTAVLALGFIFTIMILQSRPPLDGERRPGARIGVQASCGRLEQIVADWTSPLRKETSWPCLRRWKNWVTLCAKILL